jgi:hypothetical protein
VDRGARFDGAHAIAVLSERVSDDYLAFLQAKGVSYVFGGRARVDLARADAKEGRGPSRALRLTSVERRAAGIVWLRYRF